MLAPDSRAVLLRELKPPTGFAFDSAVATTFTLDLTSTLIPALAFSSYSFSGRIPDPVAALESVRRTAQRLDVFCQGGNIGVPGKAPDLLAFLEPMVHEVRRPSGGLFHPKVWFVKYTDDDQRSAYRLLVLTRNLTADASWDLAVRLDSSGLSRRALRENRPLQAFLRSMPGRTVRPLDAERTARVERLATEAGFVEWEYPEAVESVTFHYLDHGREGSIDFAGARHLVVSPFVNDNGLNLIRPDGPISILSRQEELEKLTPESVARLDAYLIDTLAGFRDEPEAGEKPADGPAQGLLGHLHAKMYVIEPHGRAHRARLIIGSTNATDAALRTNVEFCVEFEGPRKHLGIDAFLGDDAPFRTLLESYQPVGGAKPDSQEDEQKDLDNVLRAISEITHTVTVAATAGDGEPRHDLRVTADRGYTFPSGWKATLELLTSPGAVRTVVASIPIDETFTGVETADITPFLVVRITTLSGLTGGTVLVAELVGDPVDRLDVVLARQIDTPEKFLRFLYLLLSLGDPALLAALASGDGSGSGGFNPLTGGPGVLELVLRALAESPSVLEDLDRLIRRLQATDAGRGVLPEGLDELWGTVQEARKVLAKTR
jgi:hypothetical protein